MFRALALALFATTLHAQVQETIDVSRIIVDARIWNADGTIPTTLAPADLRARVDGKPAEIVSVEWVYDLPDKQPDPDSPAPARKGRTLIYLVQTDFGRAAQRVAGEMNLIHDFGKFLDTVSPDDRIALLTFDSHLVLRLDFTNDREQLRKAFDRVLRIEDVGPVLTGASPSLAALLDPATLRRTATSEEALTLLARVLRTVDGPKSLILFGWGLSDPLGGKPWVSMSFHRMSAELAASRITVYSLNFGVGAQMRAGLESMAEETGGFYASTHGVAFDNAIQRLESALQGHFEIELKNPVPARPGAMHSLDVSGVQRGLQIEAKRSFVDR